MTIDAMDRPVTADPDEQKTHERIEAYATKLKVLGHPVRLKLLCMIARQEDPCVSELWVCLKQPQPVVSQHLAVLKDRNIVKSEVQGNRRIYSIVDPFVRDLIATIDCDA